MKIYIIEDDEAVISMLEDIIEGEGLGTVCGSSTDGYTDLIDIFAKAPDGFNGSSHAGKGWHSVDA